MARCHRIGQTKAVQVYKLCTKGTYEMHMLATANTKLGLEHAIMKTGSHAQSGVGDTGYARRAKLDEETLEEHQTLIEKMLRSGAQARARSRRRAAALRPVHGIPASGASPLVLLLCWVPTALQVLNPEQDAQANAFEQSSIDDILAHYSETKQLGDEGTTGADAQWSQAKEGGSFFSQASFIAESGTAVDMDDPAFWSKMLPGHSRSDL